MLNKIIVRIKEIIEQQNKIKENKREWMMNNVKYLKNEEKKKKTEKN